MKEDRADWERIEREYRAGILSVREIARACGVSHTAIQKRADKDNWSRDLGAKIRARADEMVAKAQVATQVAGGQKLATIVEANASMVASTLLSHRRDIARTRDLGIKMLGELELATDHPDTYEKLAELVHVLQSGDTSALMLKAAKGRIEAVLYLPERVKTFKALVETTQRLVALEREALNIGPVKPGFGEDESPPPAASGTAREHYTWLCQQRPKAST